VTRLDRGWSLVGEDLDYSCRYGFSLQIELAMGTPVGDH
jgi:hypothetical protein